MSCKFIWYNLPKQIKDKLGINDSKGWSNIPKRVNKLLDTLKIDKPTCYSTLFPNGHNILWHNLPNKLESVCELIGCEENYNFDITANWGANGVNNKQDFIDFLSGQGASSVEVVEFKLENKRLQANINVEGLSQFGMIVCNRLEKIGGFDSNLSLLSISGGSVGEETYINPDILLPETLVIFEFSQSNLTNIDFILPVNVSNLFFAGNKINSITSVFPNNLTFLTLDGNLLESFTNQLPETLTTLDLSNNLLTTSSYITMEDWATNLPTFTSECQMIFTGNIDSITGTGLETILLTKNVVITP